MAIGDPRLLDGQEEACILDDERNGPFLEIEPERDRRRSVELFRDADDEDLEVVTV